MPTRNYRNDGHQARELPRYDHQPLDAELRHVANSTKMDAITTLRQQALLKRNARILAARREYHAALMAIKSLARKLDLNQRGRPSKSADYSGLRAATVAREMLSEGKPLTSAELTVEVQRPGCRPLDDPRAVAHIERFNLTLRMSRRRFTRLTNGHSKSLRHHKAMQSLFVAWYNFGRKHEVLKGTTPAMASQLTDHVWTIKELIERAAEV